MSNILSADFETNNYIDDCRVWLWGCCELGEKNYQWGCDIESFLEWLDCYRSPVVYFHNLKFDSNFIMHWLLNNNIKYVNSFFPGVGEFSCGMSNRGQLFYLKYCLKKKTR